MIKENLLNILTIIIGWLTHFHLKLSKTESKSSPYNFLSPTDDAENIDYYTESLNWALLNRNKIKNIAISGPYGSGKSSVLQTFKKRNKNKDFKFLNISLATFKEIKTDPPKPEDKDLLRLIELSILQQFFYHEKDDKIPDSRFKKIKSHSKWFFTLQTISFIVFLISFLYLVFPEFLVKFSLISIAPSSQNSTHFFAVIIFIIGFFFILFKITQIIKSIVIKKIGINNASIEIDNSISKSILNNHLDEILYFFQATNYNTVIIEDIDRFEQTEIFTKLRELNLLINNSKKTKENIVFIYAIRDDMFKDRQRTKFFDFMIPIIPVINSSNSNEKLLKIIEENNYKISDDLVSDISLFIDDMRLLFNIMNEYHIYSKSLDKNLNQNQLLSMIVYKNMHPIDFTDLSNNKGFLYSTISNKQNYIKEKEVEIDNEIRKIKNQIEVSENYIVSNLKELRTIYLSKIIEKINVSKQVFYSFSINETSYSINQATEENAWEYIINTNGIQYQYGNHYSHNRSSTYSISKIENEVDSKLTYKERENSILSNDKIDNLKHAIEVFEESKNQIKKHKIKELLSNKLVKVENIDNIDDSDKKQSELINILLRNGYIDEDYFDYISIFYEGSLSKSDYQFLINVKTQKNTEFDFKLNKVDNLIKKINQLEFEKEYILNYSLLDFLLLNNKKIKTSLIFEQLKNESKESINFIDGFIRNTSEIEQFIKTLCNKWANIWHYLEIESDFSEEKKEKYFKLIIEHAAIKDIKNIFDNYKSAISDNPNFLSLIKDEGKLKSIITELQLKFTDLNFENSPEDLLDFAYRNNHYVFSENIMSKFIKKYEEFDQVSFDNSNYSFVLNSKSDSLINYVNSDIDSYIKNLYLKIESNINEEQKTYLLLLNNESLDLKLKKGIIEKISTKVTDISLIENNVLKTFITNSNKVEAKWSNLLFIYKNSEDKITKEIIYFINNIENAKELSNIKIPTKVNEENIYGVFIRKLIDINDIENESYNLIANSIPWWYSDLNISNLDKEKIHSLIKERVISPTIESFKQLKEYSDGLNIELLERHKTKFLEIIDELDLDGSDLALILGSRFLKDLEKIKFLESCTDDIILSNNKNLNLIGQLILNGNLFDRSELVLKEIILSESVSSSNRMKIFNKNLFSVDHDFIEKFLIKLGSDYENIPIKNKKAKIFKNSKNRDLLNNLIDKNYISSFSEGLLKLTVNHKRK